MAEKNKRNNIFIVISLLIILYIFVVFSYSSTINNIIVENTVSSSTNLSGQRAYVVEENLTYWGNGTFGVFPYFTYYVEITNYTGNAVTQYIGDENTLYYYKITSGVYEDTLFKAISFYNSPQLGALNLNETNMKFLENQTFELYKIDSNNPVRGFVSIYDDIFLGSTDINVAYTSVGYNQNILYWNKGTFLAGSMDNINSDGQIPTDSVGLGNFLLNGISNVAIKGKTLGNTIASISIGGIITESFQSVAIGNSMGISTADESTAIGKNVFIRDYSDRSIAIGVQSNVYGNASNSLIIGYLNNIGTSGSLTDPNYNNKIIGDCGEIEDNTIASVLFTNCDVGGGGGFTYNTLNNNYTFSFGLSKSGSGAKELGAFNYDKGLLVGGYDGNNITMTGDDLYVTDNTEIDGYLVLGNNTETGLTDGDINASTIYYDTLTAKSPIMMCSIESMKCFVMDVEAEKEYYVTIDENYNIIDAKDKKDKKAVDVTQSVKDKLHKLKLKKQKEDARNVVIDKCKSLNGTYSSNGCIKKNIEFVSYEEAVTKIEIPIYSYKEVLVTTLNETKHEVVETTRVKDEIVNYREDYVFKTGCGWIEEQGYYCETTQKLDI